MSIHGTYGRRIELCSIDWKRHIPEQGMSDELTPGWNLKITLPFVDVTVDSFGWDKISLKDRLLRKPYVSAFHSGVDVSWAGFSVGVQGDNGNDPEPYQTGDCTVLG